MEWYINRGSKTCCLCEKTFSEEEVYFSALYDEKNLFVRRDFCFECWDKKCEINVFSHWKTKVPKKLETVQRYANINVFYDLFKKLENENDLSRINFRYVLSLYLMRKKILKLISSRKSDGNEYLVLLSIKEGTQTEVLKTRLTKEEILSVTDEIGKLVNCSPKVVTEST